MERFDYHKVRREYEQAGGLSTRTINALVNADIRRADLPFHSMKKLAQVRGIGIRGLMEIGKITHRCHTCGQIVLPEKDSKEYESQFGDKNDT